jgi:hypothetical protein
MSLNISKAKMGPVSTYKGCFIMPVGDRFAVIDRITGLWTEYSNQRSARWNATVWTRLSGEFNDSVPLTPTKMNQLNRESALNAAKEAKKPRG